MQTTQDALAAWALLPEEKDLIIQRAGNASEFLITVNDETEAKVSSDWIKVSELPAISTPGQRTDLSISVTVDENLDYMPDKRGDVVSSLERSIEALGDYRALDDSTVVACLRSIIHFMGDMHCPGHVRYGGGKLKSYAVYFDGRKYNYHSVWDDGILQAVHRWGYIEYGHQLDRCRKEEIREICSGTLRDWFRENAETSRHIYELVAPEQHLDAREARSFFNHTHAMAERQILRAGYRLAHVLNELFG